MCTQTLSTLFQLQEVSKTSCRFCQRALIFNAIYHFIYKKEMLVFVIKPITFSTISNQLYPKKLS